MEDSPGYFFSSRCHYYVILAQGFERSLDHADAETWRCVFVTSSEGTHLSIFNHWVYGGGLDCPHAFSVILS